MSYNTSFGNNLEPDDDELVVLSQLCSESDLFSKTISI